MKNLLCRSVNFGQWGGVLRLAGCFVVGEGEVGPLFRNFPAVLKEISYHPSSSSGPSTAARISISREQPMATGDRRNMVMDFFSPTDLQG